MLQKLRNSPMVPLFDEKRNFVGINTNFSYLRWWVFQAPPFCIFCDITWLRLVRQQKGNRVMSLIGMAGNLIFRMLFSNSVPTRKHFRYFSVSISFRYSYNHILLSQLYSTQRHQHQFRNSLNYGPKIEQILFRANAFCFFFPVHFLSLFPKSPGFSFAMWFGYAFPQMVVLLFVAWIWIQLMFLKFK